MCRRQSLKNACPDARMCRRCCYGPMEKSNCSNLQTHSHQYQNACPRCGDHASRWDELPRWDGRLAEETKVHVAKEENLTPIVDKVSRKVHVSVAESPDFFLHIQYPIEGYLLIQPSLGDRIIPLAISKLEKHHSWQVLRHENILKNEGSPSAGASYVFRRIPTEINVCRFLVGKITDKIFTVSGNGMINIQHFKAVLHTGTWKGCGGNPNCKVDCKTHRQCSSTCQNCGKNSHWSCCSSRDADSRFCLLGISALQSAKNSRLCRLGRGSAARYPPKSA